MSEVANLGLIRPPFVYLISIGIGLLVHWAWPVQWLPASVNAAVGIVLVLMAVVLFIVSVRTFKKAGTPVPGDLPTTLIVRAGPYRFSRNPIYVAFTMLQIGIAAWVNSAAVLIMALPALSLMALVVIPREERYLEEKFPADYLPYKREVRRWL